MRSTLIAVAIAASSATAAEAVTYTLGFDAAAACGVTICANNSLISQSYGDVAGVVDLSYRSVAAPGEVITSGAAYWYGGSYGNLSDVIYGDSGETLEIKVAAIDATALVTFDSVKYAGWPNVDRPTSFNVYSLSGLLLQSVGSVTAPGADFATYAPAITAVGGFVLQFGPDGYNAGLDDLTFSINSASPGVPEPATWAMLGLGFGLVGAAARTRRTPVQA